MCPRRGSCLSVRVEPCARVSAPHVPSARGRGSGLGLRVLPTPGCPRPGAGGGGGAAGRAGRCAQAAAAALCAGVRLRAADRHHFLLRSGQAHKREGGCRRRRPLSLRCPLPQVYYYSTGRAASPRGLAACRAVQRPGRLHAWRAPKPPPPPPYLSEKQPHVEAEKPAGGGRGRAGVCARRAPGRGRGGAPVGLRGPLRPPGARRGGGRRGEGRAGRGVRGARRRPGAPIPAE